MCVVTPGPCGVAWSTTERAFRQPANKTVQVISTLGAGDTFAGHLCSPPWSRATTWTPPLHWPAKPRPPPSAHQDSAGPHRLLLPSAHLGNLSKAGGCADADSADSGAMNQPGEIADHPLRLLPGPAFQPV
ncbi:PfkB family carbohydrate kinase [Hydrogenophaga crassostreae]|uniref:PfkB family carbohydrate kinase n=1 Tax=Hydrogenophaga crassostreae TaxID=1763535 RepID=UPI0038B33085